MATKLENLPLEMAHFSNFYTKIPNLKKCCKKTIESLLTLGIIEVSTAFENAVAAAGGHTVISKDKADLSDGSDAKLSTVRTSSKGTSYSAPVTNIHGKTGNLRVQVYERKQNKFFYFVIPRRAFRHIPKSSNIEIPFHLDGTPRRIPTRVVKENWWKWEVNSFKELSTIALPKARTKTQLKG